VRAIDRDHTLSGQVVMMLGMNGDPLFMILVFATAALSLVAVFIGIDQLRRRLKRMRIRVRRGHPRKHA
jgi:hypothetical protein